MADCTAAEPSVPVRRRLLVRGSVQGVGFRPFVYRLAHQLHLTGNVSNTARGVAIEIEGSPGSVGNFLDRVTAEVPALATITSLDVCALAPVRDTVFRIVHSVPGERAETGIVPDLAVCAACLAEVFDPHDRRFRYPFATCTHCGPRFTIIERVPYDRANTSMAGFEMCRDCRREYEDPDDRRFHAQPIACPACGPHLAFRARDGRVLSTRDAALAHAVDALRDGGIVAVKGIGGFHLLCVAEDEGAVRRLRERKHRPAKPFAVMYPTLGRVEQDLLLSERERAALLSPAAPIVLAGRSGHESGWMASVAPRVPTLGVMLPYSPLHALLLAELGLPVVATSGNLGDEPICIDNGEAVARLAGLADAFLVHDRPILRPADDSVVRVIAGHAVLLRSGRGHAPVGIASDGPPEIALALGAQLKSCIAIRTRDEIVVSQHIGDLDAVPAFDGYRRTAHDLAALTDRCPQYAIADLHPGYRNSALARELGLPVAHVQHHYAHVLACMADNELSGEVLGVCWDGTGYGADGNSWGGEFFLASRTAYQRVGHLREFRLPGGDAAVREPRRAALALIDQLDAGYRRTPLVTRHFSDTELRAMTVMMRDGRHAPITSSAGRLFDGIAAVLQLCDRNSFEGQAAMALEACAEKGQPPARPYVIPVVAGQGIVQLDWRPMLRTVIDDVVAGERPENIALGVHLSLARAIAEAATQFGLCRVLLTGGCFQNKQLTEQTVAALERAGFDVFTHRRVPPNDGGIATGQAAYLGEIPPCV